MEGAMNAVRLGQLSVRKVVEGDGELPFSMVMPEVSSDDFRALRQWYWGAELSENPAEAMFKLSMHSYLLEVDGLKILIDSCNGNDKTRSIPLGAMLKTPYIENLAKAGARPEDIDLVLCTHLHCDHVGWNTRLDNGAWVPTFPNARYIFSRRDYEYFSVQTHEAPHREAFMDSVLPVVEAGLADLVETDFAVHKELGDGVWLEDASGHSPGCCVIHAERKGPRALFSGDVFHHPIQLIRPEVPFFADENPQKAVLTRTGLFEKHADTDTIFFPAHFLRTSAGRVRRNGAVFRYEFLQD
jgi:glyoxylase-like metal-dependent hydrolase (beta-lactamase superfamily II)